MRSQGVNRGHRQSKTKIIAKRKTGNGHTIFAKINEIRNDRGLPMLQKSSGFVSRARHHSQEMKKAGKLFHNSGVDWWENCYKGPMSRCVSSWMRSKGHRENLLRPSIHRGAVGVAGNYATFMATS